MRNITPKFIVISLYALITVLLRTSIHIGPNIETVTAFALLSGMLFSWKQAGLLILAVMITTDLIIGNTNIFVFTWSGFLIPLLISKLVINKKLFFKNQKYDLLAAGLVGGIVSTLFFFLWTNFGVVLLTEMYPKTISGLISSYINALPFLRMQLAGNLIFAPVFLMSGKLLLNSQGFIKEKLFKT